MNQEQINLNFQLRAIELLEHRLEAPNEPLSQNPTFQFDLNLEYRPNVEHQFMLVLTTVQVYNEDKSQLYAKLQSSCVFAIENLGDYIDQATNNVRLPTDFIETLNELSISTTRGLMFGQFKGTYLHNAVLPVIDPKSFNRNQ